MCLPRAPTMKKILPTVIEYNYIAKIHNFLLNPTLNQKNAFLNGKL